MFSKKENSNSKLVGSSSSRRRKKTKKNLVSSSSSSSSMMNCSSSWCDESEAMVADHDDSSCENGVSTPVRKNVATGLRRRLRKSLRNDHMESYASQWEIDDILLHHCHVDNMPVHDDNNRKKLDTTQSSSYSNASTENLTDDDEDDDDLFLNLPVRLVRATPDSFITPGDDNDTSDTPHRHRNRASSPSRRQLFSTPSVVRSTISCDDDSANSFDQSNLSMEETVTSNSLTSEAITVASEKTHECNKYSFAGFRINYLIVLLAIMLADGLQGTHLYVLYEGYGYSVASLYCLGFVSGAVTSPFVGPLVDGIGRKKAAMLYCLLEMIINYLEQHSIFAGLIISRVVGGVTTNLLYSVFESWLVTEHRKRGFDDDQLETILCDSVIASNLAAIFSGYLSHILAAKYGAVGPFEGAVVCTAIALVLVTTMWSENYGSENQRDLTFRQHMVGAFQTIVGNSKIFRIGLIQGLTEGTLQTFVFLWSPAMRSFATSSKKDEIILGINQDGQPAYGLIFSAFMACGVIGGLSESTLRKSVAWITGASNSNTTTTTSDHDDQSNNNPSVKEESHNADTKYEGVEFLTAMCYFVSALLLLLPYILAKVEHDHAFSISLGAFLIYEFLVGVYMPCEGVIRSMYMPNESICSLMTMLRVIVNIAVALGVISTNYVDFTTAFLSISCMIAVAGMLQLSLVSKQQWNALFHIKTVVDTTSDQACKVLIRKENHEALMPSIPSSDDGRNLPGRTSSEVSCHQ